MDIIRVSATSRTSAVAGAIAGVVRDHMRAEVQAIGAGAVNQAMKALILATGYLRGDGIEVCAVPEFVDVEIEGNIRTAIKLVVEHRHPSVGETQADGGKQVAESGKLKAESGEVEAEVGTVKAESEKVEAESEKLKAESEKLEADS